MPDPADPADRPEPPRRKTRTNGSATGRARFSLPAEGTDERIEEGIEAFLDGPERRRRRSGKHLRNDTRPRPRPPIPLDTRTDWDAALRQEDARMARYGRPASVVVLSLALPANEETDRYAGRVGAAIRAHARETDRVARVGPGRFHVLLPETVEAEAIALAARLREACSAAVTGQPREELEIRAVAASPARGGTLAEALRRASLYLAE